MTSHTTHHRQDGNGPLRDVHAAPAATTCRPRRRQRAQCRPSAAAAVTVQDGGG